MIADPETLQKRVAYDADGGRPAVEALLLVPAPGNLHDVTVAPSLIALSGPLRRLIADKA
jgi:hypothetical protein